MALISNFTIKIGVNDRPWFSVMVCHPTPTPLKIKCYFFQSRVIRCIAHDRRGHGRSIQALQGNNIDSYADDLAKLVAELDLKDVIHVGHSTVGSEISRYIGRHGTKRVAKAVLIGAVTPFMLKTATNPHGLEIKVFDDIRRNVLINRSQYFKDFSAPFYADNRTDAKISQGLRDTF